MLTKLHFMVMFMTMNTQTSSKSPPWWQEIWMWRMWEDIYSAWPP